MSVPSWSFYNPTDIHFGLKFPDSLKDHILHKPTLYVTSQGATKRGWTKQASDFFQSQGILFKVLDQVVPNPSFDDLVKTKDDLADFHPEQIIACGGGSVMDLGKILSYVLAKDAPFVADVLSILVQGKPLPDVKPVPMIAIPTTAGTGSEVTPFATIWDMKNKKKYSVSGRNLFPSKALLCPALTQSLPWDVTISTGLDAFSQALESVWNKNYTPLTGALAAKSIRTILKHLPVLQSDPENLQSRSQMLEASLLSGLCISKTRTAIAHSVSYPLTAHFGTPHGIACSFTLPELWAYNVEADDGRMRDLCETLNTKPEHFASQIMSFMDGLGFSDELKKTIQDSTSVLKLCGEMYTPGRSDNNLRDFSTQTLQVFVERSLDSWL